MATQFTPCPACGAVGEVGSNCQFCGTAIILKEGAILSDARIVKRRTVTPQQYAEKISIYHNIVGLNAEISKVCIGEQEGLINLNGDLIYPLGNERITYGIQDNVVRIGRKCLNLETFEYTEDVYSNKFVLEKIKLLSDAISNNPSEDGMISVGFADDIDGLVIRNASTSYVDNIHNFTPQLMISFEAVNMERGKCAQLMQRFSTCEDWKLFESISEDLHGKTIPANDRHYYILCGLSPENCCEILLRILKQVYDILPYDAHEKMECSFGIFGESDETNNYIPESANSGCLGMFALMIGIGGTGIYGLVELVSSLIA